VFLRGRLGDLLAMIEATDCTGGWTTVGVLVRDGITLGAWTEEPSWGLVAIRGVFTSMVCHRNNSLLVQIGVLDRDRTVNLP
jgi:hypothetical protein